MYFPIVRAGDWATVDRNFRLIGSRLFGPESTPTFGTFTLSNLSASNIVATDATKALESVTDLTSWIAGTANRVTVADDGDGTVTLSLPQDIDTSATLTLSGINMNDGGTIGLAGGPLLTYSSTWPKLTLVTEYDEDSLLIKRTAGANSSSLGLGINEATGYSYIQSYKVGSGTPQPLRFYVGSNTLSLEIDTSGNADFQDGNLTTSGTVDASAGEVLVEDNSTSAPTSKSDGYIGVAKIGADGRIYFVVEGIHYYVDGTPTTVPVTGNPIGLLLALTYNIP